MSYVLYNISYVGRKKLTKYCFLRTCMLCKCTEKSLEGYLQTETLISSWEGSGLGVGPRGFCFNF